MAVTIAMARRTPMIPTPGRPVTPEQIARRLIVNPTTVRRWIVCGHLAAVNIGSDAGRACYRIYREDIKAFLLARGMPEERFYQIFPSNWF